MLASLCVPFVAGVTDVGGVLAVCQCLTSSFVVARVTPVPDISAISGVHAVASILAIAGVPAVAGFPAVAHFLALADVPALVGFHLLLASLPQPHVAN